MNKSIAELDNPDFVLISDSQDVKYLKAKVGKAAKPFDAFLVTVGNGDFAQVWGFNGIIPAMSKQATLVYSGQMRG